MGDYTLLVLLTFVHFKIASYNFVVIEAKNLHHKDKNDVVSVVSDVVGSKNKIIGEFF